MESGFLSKGSLWVLVPWEQQTLKIGTEARGHLEPTISVVYSIALQIHNMKERQLPVLSEPVSAGDFCFMHPSGLMLNARHHPFL